MKTFCASLLFLLCFTSSYCQNHWQLKKDTNGIKIYIRSIPDSNFNEYKANTTLNTSLRTVLQELLSAPKYNANTAKSGVSYYVKQIAENQHLFYVKKDLPWPLKDRDIITLLTVKTLDDNSTKLTLEALPTALSEHKNTVRIKTLMGYWLLENQNNKTKITQQLFLNPEGTIPPFVSNLLLVKGPFDTFLALKKLEKQNT